MANLLYLVHRLPYPPNKGDKVRSYHVLKHLAQQHRVFLGTFIDDPDDERHVDRVATFCAGLHVVRIEPRAARLKSLSGLATGMPLTLAHYDDRGLRRWVEQLARDVDLDACVVFSSAMAPYARSLRTTPMLVDFVDVDSSKWGYYADTRRWPLSWLYRRESASLLGYERSVAAASMRSFFVTPREAALFRRLAPECAEKVEVIANGVDTDHFSPDQARVSPFDPEVVPLVFTGAMDYWPNADAVAWFVADMLPRLVARHPALRLFVVGRNPSAKVRSLASDRVVVTGTVADVRPYLQHAAVAIAPLRMARGVQNKVLEAMSMGRPVVATSSCVEAVGARSGIDLAGATDVADFVNAIDALLSAPEQADAMGGAGREWVRRHCTWEAQLHGLDRWLAPPVAREARESVA